MATAGPRYFFPALPGASALNSAVSSGQAPQAELLSQCIYRASGLCLVARRGEARPKNSDGATGQLLRPAPTSSAKICCALSSSRHQTSLTHQQDDSCCVFLSFLDPVDFSLIDCALCITQHHVDPVALDAYGASHLQGHRAAQHLGSPIVLDLGKQGCGLHNCWYRCCCYRCRCRLLPQRRCGKLRPLSPSWPAARPMPSFRSRLKQSTNFIR